jgi:tRNA G18 (ribose-2'-O)-methylase SpoU
MTIIRLSDTTDLRLKAYTSLTNHQLRNSLDPARGVAIVESQIAIRVALAQGVEPLSLLLDERHLQSMEPLLARLDPATPVYAATREVMSQITGFEVTRGYLCALRRPQPLGLDEALAGARRVAVLEGIIDVSNVGAIFRSAAALGMDAVLLAPGCADPFTRRALRVSMGCVLRVPWARLPEPWPDAAVGTLHEQGFCCAALALRDDALPLDAPELKAHERLALFLGTEGTGLTNRAIDACDTSVIIPMANDVDSLNVGAAAAIAFWELRFR